MFVKLDSGDPSLEDFLGKNLIGRLEPLNLERLFWFERRQYTVNCNWKVFVDNYLDGGYHVPHIHGGLNSVLDYSNYKIETGERFCVQSSPIVPNVGEGKTAEVRKGERAFYYWIYPNLMINIYDGVMDTNLVIPRGIDQDRSHLRLLLCRRLGTGPQAQPREHRRQRTDPSRRRRDLRIRPARLELSLLFYRPAVSSARSGRASFSQAAACV